ncbi:MAG TPA: hypothetical protein VJO35_02145 [Terriglobales bacterium]|nr:hypothetical protein [Terriglobales bacterium]
MRRAVWGLSGGILVSLLPYAVAKIGSNLLLPLFVLLWPGEILGLATSGWNAQLLTVCLVVITNIAFYTAVIYVVLTRLHDRNQAKRNAE